jgi:hypothetical protein
MITRNRWSHLNRTKFAEIEKPTARTVGFRMTHGSFGYMLIPDFISVRPQLR